MVMKVLSWAVAAFVIFYVLTQPAAAGHDFHSLLNGLKTAATALGTFITSA